MNCIYNKNEIVLDMQVATPVKIFNQNGRSNAVLCAIQTEGGIITNNYHLYRHCIESSSFFVKKKDLIEQSSSDFLVVLEQ